jgi:hypothetical protein
MTQLDEKSTPDEKTFKAFERLLSRQRFQRYRRDTANKQEAVALYLWNVALCESLYPAFQFFEIALRNATSQAIALHNGNNPRWFMGQAVLTEPKHRKQVKGALTNLVKKNKGRFLGSDSDPYYPREPYRVVAELTLGFWINLYSDPYATTLVQTIVAEVFPNGPKEVKTDKRQDVIYPRLLEILNLRNRAFHHEPIYHWTYVSDNTSLFARHSRLWEVISWMCQVQPFFLQAIDRFVRVHNGGSKPYLDEVSFAFLQNEEQNENPV